MEPEVRLRQDFQELGEVRSSRQSIRAHADLVHVVGAQYYGRHTPRLLASPVARVVQPSPEC